MARIKPSRFLILLLLPALMWLFFNATFNRHIHVLADGYVITHAHPFVKNQAAKDPTSTHRHTQKELLLFGLFCEIAFSVLAILVLRPYLQVHPQIRRQELRHHIPIRKNFQVHHYHAPPCSS
jgi:multisubunit Na+/H+ antiporter MnhE subunit